MVRNTGNNPGAGHAELPPPGMDPTGAFDRILQSLEIVQIQPVVHQFLAPSPLRWIRDKLLERFQAL